MAGVLVAGTNCGKTLIYDSNTLKIIFKMKNNVGRVGAVSWNVNILTTGGKDKIIRNYDIRCP